MKQNKLRYKIKILFKKNIQSLMINKPNTFYNKVISKNQMKFHKM